MSLLMYDASDPSAILNDVPNNAQAVAGYTGPVAQDNRYVTFDVVLRRFFGHAHCLSIAVQAHIDAAVLDIETGDATPDQALGWFRRQVARGQWRPCFYGGSEALQQVVAIMNQAGIPRSAYRLWIAAYPGTGANVPQGYDAHQYSNNQRPDGSDGPYDTSICNDDFFPTAPADPNHYGLFYTGPFKIGKAFFNERLVVERYDQLRNLQTPTSHPQRAQINALRGQLKLLAGRVWVAALPGRIGGKFSWDKFNRGWRFQQLIRRSQGHLFVNGRDAG